MAGILEGVSVLDFSRMLAGPLCGATLADFGADVVRVEPPGGGIDRFLGPFGHDGSGLVPLCLSRNKYGITLNLASEEGGSLMRDLVRESDVVIHNYTPGAPEWKLLTYEALSAINPRVVVVIITAYGPDGPYATRPALDTVLQAESGAMSCSGFPGNPPTKTMAPYVDVLTGTNAALGVLLALMERQKTGKGQLVDAALMDGATNAMGAYGILAETAVTGEPRRQMGNHSAWAYSDTFLTRDGVWLCIVIFGQGAWRSFLKVVGHPELEQDTRFSKASRLREHREDLSAALEPIVREFDSADLTARLEAAHVPCGRVNDTAEVVQHPQIVYRKTLAHFDLGPVGKIPANGVGVKLSRTPGVIRRNAPMAGADNVEIYAKKLGIGGDRLAELRAKGVV